MEIGASANSFFPPSPFLSALAGFHTELEDSGKSPPPKVLHETLLEGSYLGTKFHSP